MPTYDYQCAACGHETEVFQSIHESPLRKCPKCGKPKLERRIGPGAGFLFKGGGFYQTDYRSESYKRGESAEKGAAEPVSGKDPAAGQAAPAKESPKAPEKPPRKSAAGKAEKSSRKPAE